MFRICQSVTCQVIIWTSEQWRQLISTVLPGGGRTAHGLELCVREKSDIADGVSSVPLEKTAEPIQFIGQVKVI